MKILKSKDTKEILNLLQELQSLSHQGALVTDSVQNKLSAVENILNQMNSLTQLQTVYKESSRTLSENIDELKSLVVSKNG